MCIRDRVLNEDGTGISGDDGDGIEEADEDWVYEDKVQWNKSSGTNTYAVIMGQALVLESLTNSWALDESGAAIESWEMEGYNSSVTTVTYGYNGKGQITGADGVTEGDSNSGKVVSVRRDGDGNIVGDLNGNGYREATGAEAETWELIETDQRNTYRTESRYGVIQGQTLVVRSYTKSWVTGADSTTGGSAPPAFSPEPARPSAWISPRISAVRACWLLG